MADTLASLAVDLGVDANGLRAGLRRAVTDARRAGNEAGSGFAIGFNSRLLNAVAGVGDLLNGVQQGLRFLGTATGSNVAAEFGIYRRQLTAIAGDAKAAERAFKSFQNTAINSNFNTDEIARFGLNVAGRTGNVDTAAREVQQTVDAAQVAGVQNSNFGAFQFNLSQIRNQGDNKAHIADLQQLRNYAPTLSAAVARTNGISVSDASKKISESTGTELANLITALGEKNKGAAATAAGADPFAVAANTVDSFNSAMEPTGRIVNAALLPLAQSALYVTTQFGRLNAATRGNAGLLALLGLTALGFRQVGGGLLEMRGAASIASIALRELAASATTTAVAEKTGAIAGGVAGVGKSVAGAAVGGAVAALGSALVLALAAFIGQRMVFEGLKNTGLQEKSSPLAREAGAVLRTIGTYGQKGADIGTPIPFVGTLGGGAIGTGIGWLAGLGQSIGRFATGKAGTGAAAQTKADSAAERTAKASEDAAKSLREMKASAVGGGERFAGAVKGLEFEYALLRQASTGFA